LVTCKPKGKRANGWQRGASYGRFFRRSSSALTDIRRNARASRAFLRLLFAVASRQNHVRRSENVRLETQGNGRETRQADRAQGSPEFATVLKVMRALGLKLKVAV
jgi:hypothetical protein